MSKWLNHFAYRTGIGVLPFLLSALMMFGITGLTVSCHVIRIAKADPVDRLRYE